MKSHSVFGALAVAGLLCLLLGHATPAWAEGDSCERQMGAEETDTAILGPAPGPPEWGKNIPGSSGELKSRRKSKGAFLATIKLSGLEKEKAYKLGFNGKEGYDGNEQLKKFGKWRNEGKYDFRTIVTDDSGSVSAKINVRLPASRYDVKFFVKDIADKYVCVLHNDDVRFEIE